MHCPNLTSSRLAPRSQSSLSNLRTHALTSASTLNLLFCDPLPRPCKPPVFDQPAPDHAIVAIILQEWDRYDWRGSSDALADWLNGRWKKTGYRVQRHEVCFLLRVNGRQAGMGLGDWLKGAFYRRDV